jgi:hypothetical protein
LLTQVLFVGKARFNCNQSNQDARFVTDPAMAWIMKEEYGNATTKDRSETMNVKLEMRKGFDWERLGNERMLECEYADEAIEICGLHLHACSDELQPKLTRLHSDLDHNQHHARALHELLYERAVPVNDSAMLTHSLKATIYLMLALAASAASSTSNLMMFLRLGWEVVWSVLAALTVTALPLAFGHLLYEKIIVGHKRLERALVLAIALLVAAAGYRFGQARQVTADASTEETEARSYVDDPATNDVSDIPRPQGTETKIKARLGSSLFLASIAAELSLGLLVGLYIEKRTDQDYASWKELRGVHARIVDIEAAIGEGVASLEIAKKQCMAGIRRAEIIKKRRRSPYHKVIAGLILFTLSVSPALHSQMTQRYEAILIDTSRSIARGRSNKDLFEEYLQRTKRLLATEPPNTRVWVSAIGTDSFGGAREILKGFTPDAHGIFTDDLNRARRQLAISFDSNSSTLSAADSGTDIFGALWHVNMVFESGQARTSSDYPMRDIWIFSDMMNETKEFPMPRLLEFGPERMLDRAKENNLIVPLTAYTIHIVGASPTRLTSQQWISLRQFWKIYFSAAGAELISYSAECETQRPIH